MLCIYTEKLQSCLTLWDPMGYSPPSSSVHGILQARTLEWVVMPSSGDLPDLGIQTVSLTSPALEGRFFTISTILGAPWVGFYSTQEKLSSPECHRRFCNIWPHIRTLSDSPPATFPRSHLFPDTPHLSPWRVGSRRTERASLSPWAMPTTPCMWQTLHRCLWNKWMNGQHLIYTWHMVIAQLVQLTFLFLLFPSSLIKRSFENRKVRVPLAQSGAASLPPFPQHTVKMTW